MILLRKSILNHGETIQKHTFKDNGCFSHIPLGDEFPFSEVKHVNGYFKREQVHRHDCIELGLCLGGNGIFFIGSDIYQFMEGSVSVISAGTPHIGQSPEKEPSKWRFINVGSSFCKHRLSEGVFNDEKSRSLIKLIFDEFDSNAPDYKENVFKLCEVFFSQNSRGRLKSCEYNNNYEKILPALELIAQRSDEHISVKSLANACYLNENYFRGVFKKCVGCTPVEHVNRTRLANACHFLKNSTQSVAEIAEKCGFATLSSFNRLFKKVLGKSPTDYRREFKD